MERNRELMIEQDNAAIETIKRTTGVQFSQEQENVLRHHGGMCILACAGSGKALLNGTKVLTPRGYKPVEKLIVGEDVYDEHGNIQKVIGVFPQGMKGIRHVRFDNGHTIDCCSEHLWSVCDMNSDQDTWDVLDTSAIQDKLKQGTRLGVPAHKLIQLMEKDETDLKIDPYMVGLIAAHNIMEDEEEIATGYEEFMDKQQLEDYKRVNHIPSDSNDDMDYLDAISTACIRLGELNGDIMHECFRIFYELGITTFADETTGCLRIMANKKVMGTMSDMYDYLEKSGMMDKQGKSLHTIPMEYAVSSVSTRMEVMRGIIDSSGVIHDKKYMIPCMTETLASAIIFIVDTLGIVGSKITKQIDEEIYTVEIPIYAGSLKLHTIPNLDYDYFEATREYKNPPKALEILSISDEDDFGDMTCIMVSGNSKLFLTERCIATHNTTIVTNLIAKRIMTHEIGNPSTLLCTTYSKSGAEEMEVRLNRLLRLLGINRKVEVKTLHAVYLKVLRDFGYPTHVVSAKDRRKMLLDSIKDVGIRLNEEDFQTLDSLISYQVNNLLSDAAMLQSYVFTLKDLSLEQYTRIRTGYNNRKVQNKVIDFDDMQLYMYSLLCNTNRTDIIDYCKRNWTDIYVDEAQDMSKIQYAILRKIISDPNRLVVIGDDDQCLVEGTKVLTSDGEISIEDIDEGMNILSSVGANGTRQNYIDKTSKKSINEEVVRIRTASGKELTGTLDHMGFVRGGKDERYYYTYLLYKHGLGYKIGFVHGTVNTKDTAIRNGLTSRLFLDRGDKLWVLDTSDNYGDAMCKAFVYSYKYGIPYIKLSASNKTESFSIDNINKLYSQLDTESSAKRILDDLGIDINYPLKASDMPNDKCRLTFRILGLSYNCSLDNKFVGKSYIRTNTRNKKFADILSGHMEVIEHSSEEYVTYYECKIESYDIDLLERKLKQIQDDVASNGIYLEVDKTARLGNYIYMFMPFRNMRVGMSIPVIDNKGQIEKDTIVEISREQYNGYVYDVSVPNTRNFIANGIVVHNCIYQWRGADPSIILNVCADYEIKKFVLSTNYRCPANIVDKAAVGVKFNINRSQKSMMAHKQGGEIKLIDSGSTNLYTMSKYAYEYIRELVEDKEVSPDEIAVLSRNNNHLILLNNMLFKQGIHCDAGKEMKMTKYSSYYEVRNIIEFAKNSHNSDSTASCLDLLCTYLSKAVSIKISKIQSECGFKLTTILYMLIKHGMNMTISDEEAELNKIRLPGAVRMTISELVANMRGDTRQDIVEVYTLLREENIGIRTINLLNKYLTTSSWRYRNNNDKARTVCGLVYYVKDIIEAIGYDRTRDLLKTSERYDDGSMAVPGAKVCMSTMHGAKGREWDYVVIFADDNVSFPSFQGITTEISRGVENKDICYGIDEGRRLHYVAMTRARKELAIFTAKDNPGVYLLEAFGVFSSTDNSNDNQIIAMAEAGRMRVDILENANKTLLSDDSPYIKKIDVTRVTGIVGDEYLFGAGGDTVDTGFSLDDLETGPSIW